VYISEVELKVKSIAKVATSFKQLNAEIVSLRVAGEHSAPNSIC